MPYRRFDWHERVKAVENEYKSMRIAVNRLKSAVAHDPSVLGGDSKPANLAPRTETSKGPTWSAYSPSSSRRCDRTTGHGTVTRPERQRRRP